MDIAVLGVGSVGKALGGRLAAAGHAVRFGTRRPDEVKEAIAAIPGAVALPPAEAVKGAELVFLAVPDGAALDATRAAAIAPGTVLVDCTNPVKWNAGPVWTPPAEGSVTAALAAAFPALRLVKAFNTFGAEFHGDPTVGGQPVDVPIATDDADARGLVASLAAGAGFNPLDVGPLRNAAALENMAIVWIHMATVGGRGRQFAFRAVDR